MSADRKRQVIRAFCGLACVFAASSASATPLVTARPLDLHLDRLIAVLPFCVVLAVGTAFLLRRIARSSGRAGAIGAPWMRGIGAANVTVLEPRRISTHADVCRFACNGREYL